MRVLVIEDDEDTATSVGILLRLAGYEVEFARDGSGACRVAQACSPDVILLNIGLPGLDGWTVAKQIREQNVGKRALIVAITGYGTEADRLRSQEAGIDVHLLKPVDPEKLETILRAFQSGGGSPLA